MSLKEENVTVKWDLKIPKGITTPPGFVFIEKQ